MFHRPHVAEPMPETEGKVVRWASIYDRWANMITLGKAPAIRRQTAELAQIKPGDVVLDVGCGTGELTLQARARAGTGGQVYGIDPVPAMIEVSRQKVAQTERNIHFQVGVIEELPFPDNHFDVVLSSLMMHHLPDELKQRGLVEIYRVLKPGGTLMIVDFKRPTSFISKSIITLLMHGGMQIGVQDLAPRLAAAGFNQIANGDMSFRPLGFIRAQAQKAGDSQ